MLKLPTVERWRKFLLGQQRALPALRHDRVAAIAADGDPVTGRRRGGAWPMPGTCTAPASEPGVAPWIG